MKKFTLLLLLLFNAHWLMFNGQLSMFNGQPSMFNVLANDGVYYTSGNFLVPLRETDISAKKEILEITLCKDSFATVTVDYTFYNNSEDKTVTMAFEAAAPYNAWAPINRRGLHGAVQRRAVALPQRAGGDYRQLLFLRGREKQEGLPRTSRPERMEGLWRSGRQSAADGRCAHQPGSARLILFLCLRLLLRCAVPQGREPRAPHLSLPDELGRGARLRSILYTDARHTLAGRAGRRLHLAD